MTTQTPFRGVGISVRPEFLEFSDRLRAAVDCVEVMLEELGDGGIADLATGWGLPIAVHCVTLSPVRTDFALSEQSTRSLTAARQRAAALVSEHLSFSEVGEYSIPNFLPAARTADEAVRIANNAKAIMETAKLPLALENPVTFFRHADDKLTEAAFMTAVADQADCGLLLDVNNLYVNAVNHRFDPTAFIDELDGSRVTYLHVAGHDDAAGLLVDSHAAPVAGPVWELTAHALRRTDASAVILERDNWSATPAEIMAELDVLRDLWRAARPAMA